MENEVTLTSAAEKLKIRYYKLHYLEKTGKIPKARRNSSGHRVYTEEELTLIREVLRNQHLKGFSE